MMTVHKIGKREWEKECNNVQFKSIFSDTVFIRIYSDIYELSPCFFAVRKQNKTLILLSAFASKNVLTFPIHYMFTPIWINSKEGEFIRNSALEKLLVFLKKQFTKINLRLPVGFNDIRPFYWQGFSSVHKYTYIKDLSDLEYHVNIKRILKKENNSYCFKHNNWSDEVEKIHYNDLRKLGFSKRVVNRVLASFKMLYDSNKMLVVNSIQNGRIAGSDILLLDEYQKCAYMFFISKSHGHYKSGMPALMYDHVFRHLRNSGIKKVDMFGANYTSIAVYKSKFNPELTEFFEVNYSQNKYLYKKFIQNTKSLIKRLLY